MTGIFNIKETQYKDTHSMQGHKKQKFITLNCAGEECEK